MNELGGMWEETVAVYLKILPWHLTRGLRKMPNFTQSPGWDLNQVSLEYETGVLMYTTMLHLIFR